MTPQHVLRALHVKESVWRSFSREWHLAWYTNPHTTTYSQASHTSRKHTSFAPLLTHTKLFSWYADRDENKSRYGGAQEDTGDNE